MRGQPKGRNAEDQATAQHIGRLGRGHVVDK